MKVIEPHPIILPHLRNQLFFVVIGVGDVELLTTDLALFEGRNPLPVSFIFKDDSVAEESEETFNSLLQLLPACLGTQPGLC